MVGIKELLTNVVTGIGGFVTNLFGGKKRSDGNIGYEKTEPRQPTPTETGLGEGEVSQQLQGQEQEQPQESTSDIATPEEAFADPNLPLRYKNLIKKLLEQTNQKQEGIEVDKNRIVAIVSHSTAFNAEKERIINKAMEKCSARNGYFKFEDLVINEDELAYTLSDAGIDAMLPIVLVYKCNSPLFYEFGVVRYVISWDEYRNA